MPDDLLAKAAFEAWWRAHEGPYDVGPRINIERAWLGADQEAWRAAARAVLEAVKHDEAIALVQELREWVHSECASITLYGPEECQPCAYRPSCKLPGLAERVKAVLRRAGKEA